MKIKKELKIIFECYYGNNTKLQALAIDPFLKTYEDESVRHSLGYYSLNSYRDIANFKKTYGLDLKETLKQLKLKELNKEIRALTKGIKELRELIKERQENGN